MRSHQSFLNITLATCLFATLVCLQGCGTDSKGTPSPTNSILAVADGNNSRVLLYDTPVEKIDGATVVLGQTGFSNSGANRGKETPGANTLNSPIDVAKDSEGNFYVADAGNSRVLIFGPPFTTGMSASVVIGQPGFTTNAASLAGMGTSGSVAIDAQENLWVGDETNQRVVEYRPPFTNGMAATLIIGQTSAGSFTECMYKPLTASTLCDAYALAFDSKGDLWVADSDNNRVMEFVPPFSTGMAASIELGQPPATAFTSRLGGSPSASSFLTPVGLAFDASGDLWVSDYGFSRVLEFTPPFTNGMNANSVLGQKDFTHGDINRTCSGPAADTFCGSWGLAFDSTGRLSVSDRGNNRVLLFNPPFTAGMSAGAAIGQPNFTVGSENRGSSTPAANTLFEPFGLSS